MARLNLALLSDDDQQLGAIPETGEEIVTEAEELQAELPEIEEIDQVVSDAGDDAALLGDVAEAVAEAPDQNAPIDPLAMEMLQIVHRRLCTRNGFHRRASAMESIGTGKNARKLALEGFMDTIKRIVDGIIAGVRKAIEWVKGFFKSLFDKLGKLKKNIAVLKDKATQLKGKEATGDNAKLSGGGYVKYLTVGGKITDTGAIPTRFGTYLKAIEQIFGNELSEERLGQVESMLGEISKRIATKGAADSGVDEIYVRFAKLTPNFRASADQKGVPDGFVRGEQPLPLGDKSIFALCQKIPGEGSLSLKMHLGDTTGVKAAGGDQSHDALTADDVVSLCSQIESHLATYDKVDAVIKRVEGIEKSAADMAKAAQKESEEEIKGKMFLLMIAKSISSLIIRIYLTFASTLRSYDIATCAAVAGLGHASLNAILKSNPEGK